MHIDSNLEQYRSFDRTKNDRSKGNREGLLPANPFSFGDDDEEVDPDTDHFSTDWVADNPSQMGLVAEPSQVAVLQINYAKKSINVDVEKLKLSLWGELQDKGKAPSGKNTNLTEPVSFDAVLQDLAPKIPSDQLADISVPLCFICLLDLANKKQLQIDQSTDGNDLIVSAYTRTST